MDGLKEINGLDTDGQKRRALKEKTGTNLKQEKSIIYRKGRINQNLMDGV